MAKNGQFVEEGSGRYCLRIPASCVQNSVQIEKRFPPQPLSDGEIVSSGTLTAGHPTDSGYLWTVEVDGLSLPPLSLQRPT